MLIKIDNKNLKLNFADGDYIGEIVKRTGEFYEISLLERAELMFGKPRVVWDIGANVGNHSVYWGSSGSKVVAFEPNPKIYPMLLENVRTNLLEDCILINNLALGDKAGRVCMQIPDTSNYGTSRIVENTPEAFSDSVHITRIDDFYKDTSGGLQADVLIPDLMKIDTEGYELNVLQGASRFLSLHKPVVWVEIETTNRSKIDKMLNDFGYSYRFGPFGGSDNFFYSTTPPNCMHSLRCRIKSSVNRGRLKKLMRLFVN
tara:strand:- start:141 stop:917 length:777 start_codon:yes stop_codon:yes gene_type:complete